MAEAKRRARDTGEVRIVGARKRPLRDLYQSLLRLPWWATLLLIVGTLLALQAVFALVYMATGGVANARPHHFGDMFFFSVQTMGTIGYGTMYPVTVAAHVVVDAESIVGLLVTAVTTGLVFAKFSRSAGRIVFSREAAISTMDGVPTLMFRVGNEGDGLVVEAQLRVTLVRTERTKEGTTFYRLYDLALARDRSQALSRSWNVLHPIVAPSPLVDATPETLERHEVEILVGVVGTDDTSLQPVHARHTYFHDEIVWGARHADVLSEAPDGALELDVRRFHDLVPAEPSDAFPYRYEPDGG